MFAEGNVVYSQWRYASNSSWLYHFFKVIRVTKTGQVKCLYITKEKGVGVMMEDGCWKSVWPGDDVLDGKTFTITKKNEITYKSGIKLTKIKKFEDGVNLREFTSN